MAEEMKERSLSTEDLPPLEDHASAKVWLETVGRAVATGQLTDRAGQCIVRSVSEWVRTHESQLTAEVVGTLREEVQRLQKELGRKGGLRAIK